MDTTEMRNGILMELIDKMHSQMADKQYPDEKPNIPSEMPSEGEDLDTSKLPGNPGPETEAPRAEEDDELLEQLMKQREVE